MVLYFESRAHRKASSQILSFISPPHTPVSVYVADVYCTFPLSFFANGRPRRRFLSFSPPMPVTMRSLRTALTARTPANDFEAASSVASSHRRRNSDPIVMAAVAPPVVTPFSGVVVRDPYQDALDQFERKMTRYGTQLRPYPIPVAGPNGEVVFMVLSKVATGRACLVYVAQQEGTKKAVALKVFPVEGLTPDVQSRLAILQSLQHQNIVKCLGQFTCTIDRTPYLLVPQELCGKGPLRNAIKVAAARLPNPEAFETHDVDDLLRQLADAIAFVHRNGSLHGDLRSENVLLSSSDVVKLSAFAVTTRVLRNRGPGIELTITGGCRTYAPPEWQDSVQVQRPLTALETPCGSYDMWCLGLILCEMATLRLTFGDRVTHYRALASDPEAMEELRLDVAAAHGGLFLTIADGLLATDPAERWDAPTLVRKLSAIPRPPMTRQAKTRGIIKKSKSLLMYLV